MSFFRDIEPPEPPEPVRRPTPVWEPPHSGALGGFVPLRLELARTATHLVLLGPMEAHPSGVSFSVRTRSRSADMLGMHRWGDDSEGQMRFGVSYADGRSTHDSRWPHELDVGDGPILVPGGGGGGGTEFKWSYWLWPLPPPGPVTFHLLWEDAGIAETSTSVDAAVFIDAASRAETLWEPLSPEEEQEQARAMHRRMSRGSSFSLGHVAFAASEEEVAGGEEPSVEE